MKTAVVILAAGQGTRMKSTHPKVLHKLAGKTLLEHVIDTSNQIKPDKTIVVYGHGGDRVKETVTRDNLIWVEQKQQLGTGHAVKQTTEELAGIDRVLILYGDVPLTRQETLVKLSQSENDIDILTVDLNNPFGYGRIVRDEQNNVSAIVEQKDATEEQRKITEINSGIMSINASKLINWLDRLSTSNSQNEYYLTDIVKFAVDDGDKVNTTKADNDYEVSGVNDKAQLAELERIYQQNQAFDFMRQGMQILDPRRFDCRGSLTFGTDCLVDINVIFEGRVTLGNHVTIGANTVIRNCIIEDNVSILENCVFEDAVIGKGSKVGPFSRLRPGAHLIENNHVGNFVEIKNSRVESGSKVNHLTYVGDSEIGKKVNIGAGTITCNYDGANKHKTIIKDNVFIGSNSALVAPVTIEDNVTIGAGSVISKDAPANSLTLTRSKQISVDNWKRPVKKKS